MVVLQLIFWTFYWSNDIQKVKFCQKCYLYDVYSQSHEKINLITRPSLGTFFMKAK